MKYAARFLGTFGMAVGILDLSQLLNAAPGMFRVYGKLHTKACVLGPLLIINGFFCLLLISLGVFAWFRPLNAMKFLKWVFIAQIVYFVSQFLLSQPSLMPPNVAESFGSGFGVGGLGMYLQTFSFLPIWGLVLILLVSRHDASSTSQ
jgi:hypothetical protein